MRIQTLFASLTVLCLKMIQYEKYIDGDMSASINEALNQQRESIKAMYDKDLHLSQMGMPEYKRHSIIDLEPVDGMRKEEAYAQLIDELTVLQQCMMVI